MNTKNQIRQAAGDRRNEKNSAWRAKIFRAGFSLVELLTVIAVMAVIAAMIFPILSAVKRQQYLKTARAELEQINTALENYHDRYHVYPPSNPYLYAGVNTLFYELSGVTNNNSFFVTLGNASQIGNLAFKKAFTTTSPAGSIDGIINCSRGSGEDGNIARNFLPELKPNRFGTSPSPVAPTVSITNLVTSVRGPDANYMPLGVPDVNPFCYVYPGTNNPNSYDLWVDLKIGNKTNRICNWKSSPFIL